MDHQHHYLQCLGPCRRRLGAGTGAEGVVHFFHAVIGRSGRLSGRMEDERSG